MVDSDKKFDNTSRIKIRKIQEEILKRQFKSLNDYQPEITWENFCYDVMEIAIEILISNGTCSIYE